MPNAIILHGQPDKQEYYDPTTPSSSNAHWLPWLQAQLLKNDIAAATPEVPHAYAPDYELWKQEVERFDITPQTILVGHSRGCDFWLRWLSEHPGQHVGRVVLVAPYIGYLTKDDDHFGHYHIDPDLTARTAGLTIFGSDNDMPNCIASIAEIRSLVKDVNYTEFHYGHFTTHGMGKNDFPELLAELLVH